MTDNTVKNSITPATKPCKIADLIVTQESLRNFDYCIKMSKFVAAKGVFTMETLIAKNRELEGSSKIHLKPPKLILIARFWPDKSLYIWDGHHRVVAIYLGGREEILPVEYEIWNIPYDLIKKVNFKTGYVTPFDPKVEVRLSEFGLFKQLANDMLRVEKKTEQEVIVFINGSREKYVKKRTYKTVAELVKYSKMHAMF